MKQNLTRAKCKHLRRIQADKKVVRPAGIEPTTHCLEGSCSIQLSYRRFYD